MFSVLKDYNYCYEIHFVQNAVDSMLLTGRKFM